MHSLCIIRQSAVAQVTRGGMLCDSSHRVFLNSKTEMHGVQASQDVFLNVELLFLKYAALMIQDFFFISEEINNL